MNLADDRMADNRDLFEQMIRTFESAGLPYCILAGYDTYPEVIPSDIDFMVHPDWMHRLPTIIAALAAGSGSHLIQSIRHETTATYFVLARRRGAGLIYLHPDSSSDYRRHGRRWLRAEQVLENRRRHPQGFWIPSAADAFIYYLVKKLDKGNLDEMQALELSMRFSEDTKSCSQALHALLPAAEANVVEAAVRAAVPFGAAPWQAVVTDIVRLREALHRQAPRESLRSKLRQTARNLYRVVNRIIYPTGLSIAFMGPDGSGKSAVITDVAKQLAPAFRQVEYRHLKPRAAGKQSQHQPVTDPHGQPPRGKLGSLAKLVHFWASYWKGTVSWLYPAKICSTLVLFDRYFQDLQADPRRYRYSGPLKPAQWLGRWLPGPDLVFILDAPPEALQARKQEVPFAESARQRGAYLKLACEFRHASVIDASQPLEQVVATVLGHIVDHMQRRTARRLGLSPGK
jgi:thymidylate kinase